MRKVVIIHDIDSKTAKTWVNWLTLGGLHVDTICDEKSFINLGDNNYDLVIPLITIKDYVDKNSPRVLAMLHFEMRGLKMLTPSCAVASSSDKLKTAQILKICSLPHPQTVLAKNFNTENNWQFPIILKPQFGHSGNDVYLVQSQDDLKTYRRAGMIIQEFVEKAECIRVIASPTEVLSSYKKIPPKGELVANIDRGAKRLHIFLDDKARNLVTDTVKVMGGGLMGVDLLDSPEGLFVLEANVPFGFDQNDINLRQKLITYIKKEVDW